MNSFPETESSNEIFRSIRENKFPQSTLLIAERDSFSLEIALSIPYAMVEGFDGYRRVYPDILLSPFEDMLLSLDASYKYYTKSRNDRGKRFFAESVRRILLSYHQAFMKDGHDQKEKLFAKASDVDEKLSLFINEEDGDKAEKLADEIYKAASDSTFVTKDKKKAGLTMEELRSFLAYTGKKSGKKFLILENIEDQSESVKNALLKTLEEPPEGLYIILISKSPERVMKTILSRVRRYDIPHPDARKLNDFLRKFYFTKKDYQSLSEFYMDYSLDDDEKKKLEELSVFFIGALKKNEMPSSRDMNEFLSILTPRMTKIFLSAFSLSIRKEVLSFNIEGWKAKRIIDAFSSALFSSTTYSTNIRAALDTALREAIKCR